MTVANMTTDELSQLAYCLNVFASKLIESFDGLPAVAYCEGRVIKLPFDDIIESIKKLQDELAQTIPQPSSLEPTVYN